MGVYSTKTNADTSVNLENTGIIECTIDHPMAATMAMVAESEANYNRIMQAVGVQELAVYESTGEEMVYEANEIGGFFGKVKEFFVNLWEKIKGLFKKFFAMLDSWTKTDKEFVNKYRKHLLQINTKDFKYKGYEFTELDYSLSAADTKVQGVISSVLGTDSYKETSDAKLDEALKKAEDKVDIVEKMRSAALGGSVSLDASEFSKEAFQKFRKGEDTKQELDKIQVIDLLSIISEASTAKKEAEKAFKDLEKTIKEAIKDVDNFVKEEVKKVPDKTDKTATATRAKQIRHASNMSSLVKDKLSILQLVNGAKLAALRDQNRQAKSICVGLMNYKPKNESAFQDSFGESGFLSNVVLK